MIVGKDARQRSVRIGNTVIDDRGRAWQVSKTELTLRKQKLARVRSTTTFSTIRLNFAFHVPASSKTGKQNIRRWRRLYEKYVRPRKRQELHRRRRVARLPFKSCPVCKGGWQPCRFKLGVQVWRGKKLRVCSRVCSLNVKKEVKKEQRLHPETDREKIRLRIAWQYIRKGGQI